MYKIRKCIYVAILQMLQVLTVAPSVNICNMVLTLAQREPKSQLNSFAEMLRRAVFFMSIAFSKNGKVRICMTNTLVRVLLP